MNGGRVQPELDTSKCLPCLIVATGPFTTITLNQDDELNVTLEEVNRHTYDRVRLCRTTMDVDVGLGPLPALLTYTAAWVLPPVKGMTPLKALDVVNRALFELFLGGVRFDSASPEDVGEGFAYHTGYFMAFGGEVGGDSGFNFARLKALQSADVSTFDSICLVKPRSFTVDEINRALDIGRPISKLLPELNPTVVLDGLTALRSRRTTSSLIFLWAACETLLNRLWSDHVVPKGSTVANRQGFVKGRAWTAAHKAEVLFQLGVLNESLYGKVGQVRKARNDVAHEGAVPTMPVCLMAADVFFCLLSLSVPATYRDPIAEAGAPFGKPVRRQGKAEPMAWRHMPAVPGNERWGDAEYARFPEREWVELPTDVRQALGRPKEQG